MKKIIIALIIWVVIALVIFNMPQINGLNYDEVTVIAPLEIVYDTNIHTTGTVESSVSVSQTIQLPVIVKSSTVIVGDYVYAGDVVAIVDVNSTKDYLINLANSTELIPTQYIELIDLFEPTINMQILDFIPTTITAQSSGTITQSQLVAGNLILPTTSYVTIAKLDSNRLKLQIDESDISNVAVGDFVAFKTGGTQNDVFYAKVDSIAPIAVTTMTGLNTQIVVDIYATPVEVYDNIKAGFSVEGVVKQSENRLSNIVPYEAISREQDGNYIYVVYQNQAHKYAVELGTEIAYGVEVVSHNLDGCLIVKDSTQVTSADKFVMMRKEG